MNRLYVCVIIFIVITSCSNSTKNIPSERDKEIEELTILANQGDSIAQYHLGRIYEHEGNFSEAFDWIKKSALNGFDSAQVAMSKYFLDGISVKRNVSVSLSYCHDAAAQGNAYAQYDLASRYEKGEIASLNTERSWILYKIAAEKNEAHAQYKLGLILFNIYNYSAKEDSIAIDWITKAAKQGLPEAEHRLGRLYWRGAGVQKNREIAMDWITKSAKHGYASAQFLLGFLAKTDEEAEYWYTKASEQNLAVAQLYLEKLKNKQKDIDNANKMTHVLFRLDADDDNLPNFKYEGDNDRVYISEGMNKDKIKKYLFYDGIDPNCYDEFGLSDFKH